MVEVAKLNNVDHFSRKEVNIFQENTIKGEKEEDIHFA